MPARVVLKFHHPSRKQSLNGPSMVKRTLASSGYEADFFVDQKYANGLVHFIITRKGEAEIVMWGQERSMAEAERTALDWMSTYGDRSVAAG